MVNYDYYFKLGYETKEQIDFALLYNKPNIVSMNEPEDPDQDLSVSHQIHNKLNSLDDNLQSEPIAVSLDNKNKSGARLATNRVVGSIHAGGSIISIGTFGFQAAGDPSYYFNGTISEEVLHRYLDITLGMWGLFMYCRYYNPGDPTSIPPIPPSMGLYGELPGHIPFKPCGYGPSPNPNINLSNSGGNHLKADTTPSIIDFTDTTPFISSGINYHGGRDYYIKEIMLNPAYQIGQDMQMLIDLRPKVVPKCISFWGSFGYIEYGTNIFISLLDWVCDFAKLHIDWYHQNVDPDTMFMGEILEFVDNTANNIMIPDWILEAFGFVPYPFPLPSGGCLHNTTGVKYHLNSLGCISNFFDFQNMLNPDPSATKISCPLSIADGNHVDNAMVETQMWQVYLASIFMEIGIEAFRVPIIGSDCIDKLNGNAAIWKTLQIIRTRAKAINPVTGKPYARRGIVLFTSNPGNPPKYENIYYDPPDPENPGKVIVYPNWQRQLVLDFNQATVPINTRKKTIPGCRNEIVTSAGILTTPANFPVEINAEPNYILGNPLVHMLYIVDSPGTHPQGWICNQMPCLFDLDNSGSDVGSGCSYSNMPWYWYADYGFDIITWFALQGREERNQILKYIYYRIKCLRPFSFFLIPGRAIISYPGGTRNPTYIYRAEMATDLLAPTDFTGVFSQQDTIKELFNDTFSPPLIWKHHNFTFENVANSTAKIPDGDGFLVNGTNTAFVINLVDTPAFSSLTFIGDNKIFWIANDGYIHGYIKVSNNKIGGTWLTVSPSYSAEIFFGYNEAGVLVDATQVIANQVKAVGDLTASPDGSTLLYIGQDHKIHGFSLSSSDPWRYHYFNLGNDQPVEATSDLVFTDNNHIYFKGAYTWYYPSGGGVAYSDRQILCSFVKSGGSWGLFVPSFCAFTSVGISPLSQQEMQGEVFNFGEFNLTCYLGIDRLLYSYNISSTSSCHFNPLGEINYLLHANNLVISGSIKIKGNSIFFVGYNTITSRQDLFKIENDGSLVSGWQIINLAEQSRVLHGTLLTGQSSPMSQCGFAISADGSRIAYFGVYPNGAMNFAFYNFYGGNDFMYSTVDIDYVVSGSEHGLQFGANNNDLYFISSLDGVIHEIRYEENNCYVAESIINMLWPKI